MKTKWVEFLVVGLFLASIMGPEVAQSVDAEAMIKVGTIQLLDHGKNFQHHPAIAVGANVIDGDKIVWTFTPEFWKKLDQSNPTPDFGAQFFATLGYKFVLGKSVFVPYIGLNPGYWNRTLNPHFHVNGQDNQHWSWVEYLYFPVGVLFGYADRFYADLGLSFPGPWKTNLKYSGQIFFGAPHLYGEAGIFLAKKKIRVGVFYDERAFERFNSDIHTQGIRLGYFF